MLSNKSALTLVLPLLASVTALPSPAQWNTRSSSLDGILVPYSLSSDARDPERCAGIKRNREGYQLGSSIGGGPANAAGPLGDNATFADLTIILSELGDQSKVADEDFARANITRARNVGHVPMQSGPDQTTDQDNLFSLMASRLSTTTLDFTTMNGYSAHEIEVRLWVCLPTIRKTSCFRWSDCQPIPMHFND
jgi:hypothetical protein